MTGIVLHIGTPKTGSTAIQDALNANTGALEAAGIAFVQSGRHRAAHNDLANAIRRGGADHKFKTALADEVTTEASQRPDGQLLLSSEMFSLIDAARIRDALPFLSEHPLRIVVYLRRQDLYAEAFFKQRIKNGRTVMPFDQFLNSALGDSITDYNALLDSWTGAFPKAEMLPRVYQRDRFPGGDVVADFATVLGLPPDRLTAAETQRNISPSKDVIDIMLALAPHLDGRRLRDIYRAMKPLQLEGFSASGDLFTRDTRQAYLNRFSDANERLRNAYFPKDTQLFDTEGPKSDDAPPAGLSPAQQELLAAAFKEAFKPDQSTGDA